MCDPSSARWQYEIRVERQLGPGLAALFPELTATYEGGETILRGALPDQAALHGVLMRIRDLGLTLVALRRAREEGAGGPDAAQPMR
jgi:hypothetical protein